ncbi:MAG: zeta toxin family protein [Flavobacteriales bacterium]
MSKPALTIVAGCNGAGKSTYSKIYVKDSIIPFDYDKRVSEVYKSLPDSELREQFSKNQVTSEFESSINEAFMNKKSFCYETNFDTHPIVWAKKAKTLGYLLELHFYCLDTLEIAKERVAIRTKQNGHFVRDDVIDYKWKQGYKNLNLHYELFDFILMLDNSNFNQPIQPLFTLEKSDFSYNVRNFKDILPEYAERRFPAIYALL